MKCLFILITFFSLLLEGNVSAQEIQTEKFSEVDSLITNDSAYYLIKVNFENEPDSIKKILVLFLEQLKIPVEGINNFFITIDKTNLIQNNWEVTFADNENSPYNGAKYLWSDLSQDMQMVFSNWNGYYQTEKKDPTKTIDNKPFNLLLIPKNVILKNPTGEDITLKYLKSDYSYEILVEDDYPEQIEVLEADDGVEIEPGEKNKFYVTLTKFNRPKDFEKWAEKQKSNPYILRLNIKFIDRFTKQIIPIQLTYKFDEYS